MKFRQNRKVGLQYHYCFEKEKDLAITRNDKHIASMGWMVTLILSLLIIAPLSYVFIVGYGTVTNLQVEITSDTDDDEITPTSFIFTPSEENSTDSEMDFFSSIFGGLGGLFELFLGGFNGSMDGFNEIMFDNETISELVDYLDDYNSSITEENFLDYLTNGTLNDIIDQAVLEGFDFDGIFHDLIYDMIFSMFNGTLYNMVGEGLNSTSTIRITNKNSGFFSFLTLDNLNIKAAIIINDNETIIFENASTKVGYNEFVDCSFNLADVFSGILDASMSSLIEFATNFTMQFISNETLGNETNFMNDLLSTVLSDVFTDLNIEAYMNIQVTTHYITTGIDLRIRLSELIDMLFNELGGVM